jgi:hypothetical protein
MINLGRSFLAHCHGALNKGSDAVIKDAEDGHEIGMTDGDSSMGKGPRTNDVRRTAIHDKTSLCPREREYTHNFWNVEFSATCTGQYTCGD